MAGLFQQPNQPQGQQVSIQQAQQGIQKALPTRQAVAPQQGQQATPGNLQALLQFLGFQQQPQPTQKPGRSIGTDKAREQFRKGFGL